MKRTIIITSVMLVILLTLVSFASAQRDNSASRSSTSNGGGSSSSSINRDDLTFITQIGSITTRATAPQEGASSQQFWIRDQLNKLWESIFGIQQEMLNMTSSNSDTKHVSIANETCSVVSGISGQVGWCPSQFSFLFNILEPEYQKTSSIVRPEVVTSSGTSDTRKKCDVTSVNYDGDDNPYLRIACAEAPTTESILVYSIIN